MRAVKKQLAFVVAGLVLVLVAAASLARATAGPEPNDVQDSLPAWSSNGVDIAFERTARTLQPRVLDMSAGGKSVHVVNGGRLRGFIPGTEHLLVEVDDGHTLLLADTSRAQAPLATYPGIDAGASPDGRRVAYLRGGTLYVAALDGSGEHAVASDIAPPSRDVVGPAWSPDGSRIAIASGHSLLVVKTDGSGTQTVWTGTNQNVNPSWDGNTALAWESNDGPHWQIDEWRACSLCGVRTLLASPNANFRFPQFSPDGAELAFISDRQHVPGGATRFRFALYTSAAAGGPARKLLDDVHPDSPPVWSASGTLLAAAAAQECRRWGVYVVRAAGDATAKRRSNVCRFDGTARADRIRGSQYFDIINGNGGNDVIYGLGGNDKISGESGNDTIFGGAGHDFILGGPGNDRIYGGPGNDVIVPGNGRDVIDCGPGNDIVEGAGPLDRISKNCEQVRH